MLLKISENTISHWPIFSHAKKKKKNPLRFYKMPNSLKVLGSQTFNIKKSKISWKICCLPQRIRLV